LPEEVVDFLFDIDYQFDLSLMEKILKKLREKHENK